MVLISDHQMTDRSANTDHRKHMLVLLYNTLHDHGLVIIVLQKFLHLGRQFFSGMAPDSVDTHRFGQFHKVGVRHFGMRVSAFVKEI